MFVPDIADAERMTEVIASHVDRLGLVPMGGPCRLLDAQIRHSHRPTSSRCRGWATYAVPAGGGRSTSLLYLRGYPDRASQQAWAELAATGRTGGAIHLHDHDLIVWTFPADPSLPALAELVDPTRIVDRLPVARVEALAERQVAAAEVEPDVVRYQPETSATLRYRVAGADPGPVTLYAKAFAFTAEPDPAALSGVHERLWDRSASLPDLRVAQPLGRDEELRVLWTLGVPGPSLGAHVQPGATALLAGDVAATVAALHDSGVAVPLGMRAEDCLAEGRKKASKLGEALPRCRSAVAAIAPRDGPLGTPDSASTVVVHGDLHLDQFIAGPEGPVLVDLDSVAAGDAELDLAELVVDVATRQLPLPAVRAFVGGLLQSYERHAAARPIRLDLLRALADAEFLTRCHRHLRRRAPGWEVALERSLEQYEVLAAVLPTT